MGGGGSQAKKNVCVPKLDLQVRAPLVHFIFFPRNTFLIRVGVWVSQNPPPGGGFNPPPLSITKPHGIPHPNPIQHAVQLQ